MDKLILAINPGSTSTKISVYNGSNEVFTTTLRYSQEELAPFNSIMEQYEFRKKTIIKALEENNVKVEDLAIVVGRGGLVKPIPSGVYEVNQTMVDELISEKNGEHASNLGAVIANDIVKEIGGGVKAIIVDPVVVDELEPIARVTGNAKVQRSSIFHALNQKAIAKRFAMEQGKEYKDLNIIVAHLGGGVSVGIHKNGRVVDVTDALRGEGTFSPERSGALPVLAMVDLCFSGEYTHQEIKKMIVGGGGVLSYLGIVAFNQVEELADKGNEEAKFISDAFVYQLSKDIGAMSTVVNGKVDAILITGGIAYNKGLMERLKAKISFIAPVYVYPGEDEMGALAGSGLAILEGREALSEYK